MSLNTSLFKIYNSNHFDHLRSLFSVNSRSTPQYGFDNLDFDYDVFPVMSLGGRCLAKRSLPDYPIARIRTGQSLVNEDGSYTTLWEGDIRFDE